MTAPKTVPAALPVSRDRSVGRVFVRTCAAEWSRLWTVTVTWWFMAAAAVIMIGVATAAGASTSGNPDPPVGDPAWSVAEIVILPAQFALLAVVIMAVTSDYATAGIVPTLQWTPRRNALFFARTLVAAVTATCAGVTLAAVAGLAGWAAARPLLRLPSDVAVDALGTVALVLAAGTLLAAGLGWLLRSTAGVLVCVFLLMLVLPGLLPQLGYAWLTDVTDVLPGMAAIFLLSEQPSARGLTDTSAVFTMLAWAASALGLGWLRLVCDDANR